MSFARMLVHEVTITTPSTVTGANIYGDPEYSVSTSVSPAMIQPAQGSEEIIDRDTRIARYRVYLPVDAEVTGLSTLTWDTHTLQVDGEPRSFPTPRGQHHLELDAFEVLG